MGRKKKIKKTYKARVERYKKKHKCDYCNMTYDNQKDLDKHHLELHGKVAEHPIRKDSIVSQIYKKHYIDTKKYPNTMQNHPAKEDEIFYELLRNVRDGEMIECMWEWNKDKMEYIPYILGTKFGEKTELIWDTDKHCYVVRALKTLQKEWRKEHPIEEIENGIE